MDSAKALLEQILLGGTLQDKLAGREFSYGSLDFDRMTAMPLLDLPGRSGVLDPSTKSSGRFPKHAEIIKTPEARGRLLHFFANHELLAIETMAYVLLRFPEAPEAFKRGVFRVLQEEQEHLGQYLARMKDYGVSFGEVPLNLFFWNTLKEMRSPLDFVTQMSLTFEQANLDFALEYATLFESKLQDPVTASLLRKVHDDEVRHVEHGWKWFQEWRPRDSRSNFEVYQDLLPFPMTARRARGAGKTLGAEGEVVFAADSRIRAGMDADFVRKVRIAGGSRGRVPDFYFFNPQCEIESGSGALPMSLKQKIRDLEALMLWLPLEDDVIELSVRPPLLFLEELHGLKGALPEVVTPEECLDRFKVFQEFKPWGFGPSAWSRLKELKDRFRSPPSFDSRIHEEKLFSKAFWKTELKTAGVVISSEGGVREGIEAVLLQNPEASSFLVKSAKGTSGRGHLRIPRDHLRVAVSEGPDSGDELLEKLRKRMERGGPEGSAALVIEPYFEKLVDFSVQYDLRADGSVREFEPRFFRVDSGFQYQGAYLGTHAGADFDPGAVNALFREREALRASHARVLEIARFHQYTGPIGIDAMMVRGSDGRPQQVPVIEVNVRYTMGRIAHEIEAALRHRGGFKHGVWVFLKESELMKHSARSFVELEERLRSRFGRNFWSTTPSEGARGVWTFSLMNQDTYAEFGF